MVNPSDDKEKDCFGRNDNKKSSHRRKKKSKSNDGKSRRARSLIWHPIPKKSNDEDCWPTPCGSRSSDGGVDADAKISKRISPLSSRNKGLSNLGPDNIVKKGI